MFTWDVAKAIKNIEKHDISFEEAALAFSDSDGLDWEVLNHPASEIRRKRLGRIFTGRILLVVYTARRLSDGKETIRIISARQASRKERKAYAG